MIRSFDKHKVYPQNEPISDDLYRLIEDWQYVWFHKGAYYRIVAKKNFIYDGASVPNCLGWILDLHPDGQFRAACVPHDMLYIGQGELPVGAFQTFDGHKWVNVKKVWTRHEVDKLFARILRETGMPQFKRRMAYRAVRVGGWLPWKRDNQDERNMLWGLYK